MKAGGIPESPAARLLLINQMFKKKIITPDIYHFALKQSSLRTVNKEPDPKTVTAAMLAKQKDLKIVLFRLRKERKKLESILLDELGGRKYKWKKLLKRSRNMARDNKKKKLELFEKKLEHYESNQVKIAPKKEHFMCKDFSNKATSLNEFSDLSIFKGPDHLPAPEPPLGPYICDKNIKLDENELKILNKTPKFSVRGEATELEVLIESERMLCKHWYNKSDFKGKKKKAPETILFESEDRWHENQDRLIHNELEGSVNFANRRVTDYRPGPS